MMKLGYLEKLLVTLWVGSLWSIGYIAVPTLFVALDDSQLAGDLAGQMFTSVSFIGIVSAVIIFSLVLRDLQRPARKYLLTIIGAMLLLLLIQQFYLQPHMAELKLQGIPEGSEQATDFVLYHGVASSLYLINSLLGLALVVWPSRRAS